jgi:spore germination cell wall hydrolase CwlJ-like protein
MLKSGEYRHRQSWVEDSYYEESEEPRSAVAEYSPIIFGGMMLVAAFAFAGHYIGSNASAHTAASASLGEVPSLPQTTTLSSKSSLLGEDETFNSITLRRLRNQIVDSDGKGDLFIPDAGEAAAIAEGIIPKRKKLLTSLEQDKRIKIEPASINLKAESDVSGKAVKKLALAAKPAAADSSATLTKAEKKKQLAQRRVRQAEENCLARAIYFEARSESEMGQMAVAKVIINRTKDANYPKTICGVVYQGSQRRNSCQFSFACDGLPDDVKSPTSWAQSKRIAQKAINGDLKMGKAMSEATNYHADYVKPRWAKSMRKLVKIGSHIFYTDG